MSATGKYDDQTRAKADELAQRLKNDLGFQQQVQKDPVEALTGAGLSSNAANDFMSEFGKTGEVSGYMMCAETCMAESCVLSCLRTSW